MKFILAILVLVISMSKSFGDPIEVTGKVTSILQQTLYWNDQGSFLFFKIKHREGREFPVYLEHAGDATKIITSMLLTAKATGSDVSVIYDNRIYRKEFKATPTSSPVEYFFLVNVNLVD